MVNSHDFLKALAGAKACKQPGSDGVVVEMYVLSVGQLFCGSTYCSLFAWEAARQRDPRLGVKLC